jgi:hypothetical protein
MKMKRLQMRDNSSMFALLRVFVAAHINARNKVTSATRFYGFCDPSGAPLSDAVGYPKLFRPRSCLLGIGEWTNLCFRVQGL